MIVPPQLLLLLLLGATAIVLLLALAAVNSRKGRSEDEARAYLAGFTYVLSDDPDAAIAELSRAAQLNTQTLETYFALGALFRRKGELDRAIRLHCNILLRAGLSREVRLRALLALAMDYRGAGLRDKAVETFEKLLAEDPDHREGLVRYRQVLEEQRSWARAVELQVRLLALEKKGEDVLAHLLAAAARGALPGEAKEAEQLAEKAVAFRAASADAQLALGEARLALKAGDAAAPLQEALRLEPELAPRAHRLLAAALPAPAALERFLAEQSATHGEEGDPYELALALHERARGRGGDAIVRLRRLVERQPRFWEARKELGALLLESDRSDELRADYQEILGTLGQPNLTFACAACRQRLPEHAFRCPSCEAWGTVRREREARAGP